MRRAIVLLLITVLSGTAQFKEKPHWLDTAPKQWNKPGASIPRGQKVSLDDDEFLRKQCLPGLRQPSTAEGRAVVAKGWLLVIEYHDNRGITVVSGMQDFDGMCRPMRYQDFVFVNGKYAGTLSPVLMDSRTDGASVRADFPEPGKISATFLRYSVRDPLCCASQLSDASYEIRYTDGRPTVTLVNLKIGPRRDVF